jgi:hypothetical protein
LPRAAMAVLKTVRLQKIRKIAFGVSRRIGIFLAPV